MPNAVNSIIQESDQGEPRSEGGSTSASSRAGMSRRDFLRASALAAGALALGACGIRNPEDGKNMSLEEENEDDSLPDYVRKLEGAGLISLIPLYEEYLDFRGHTDIPPNLFGLSFSGFLEVADSVVKTPATDGKEISGITDGWGLVEGEEAISMAQERISSISIYPSETVDEKWLRENYLSKIAQNFPALAIGLPDIFMIAFPPVTTNEVVQTTEVRDKGKSVEDWYNFTHELVHVGDIYYERFKSVMNLEKYLQYKIATLNSAGLIFEKLYGQDSIEDAMEFVKTLPKWGERINGRMFFGQNRSANISDKLVQAERLLGISDSSHLSDSDRYTQIVWMAGKMQKESAKDPTLGSIFSDPTIQEFRSQALADVLHSFVPLYGEDLTGKYPATLVGEIIKDLSLKRLQTYGNFVLDENVPPEDRFKKVLGIGE